MPPPVERVRFADTGNDRRLEVETWTINAFTARNESSSGFDGTVNLSKQIV